MYSELTKHLDQYVRKQLEHYKFHSDVEDSAHYDLIIDNSRFNADQIVEFIVQGLQFRIPEWQTQ